MAWSAIGAKLLKLRDCPVGNYHSAEEESAREISAPPNVAQSGSRGDPAIALPEAVARSSHAAARSERASLVSIEPAELLMRVVRPG